MWLYCVIKDKVVIFLWTGTILYSQHGANLKLPYVSDHLINSAIVVVFSFYHTKVVFFRCRLNLFIQNHFHNW